MTKKPKCKPQNYQCGRICIKGTYICRVDGLTGQSVSIADKLKNTIQSLKTSEKIEDFSGKKELGSGLFGKVYSHEGKAYKVENVGKVFKTLRQFGDAEYKKMTVDEFREKYINSKKETLELQNTISDKGYAPRIYDIYVTNSDDIVTEMEELQGYTTVFDFKQLKDPIYESEELNEKLEKAKEVFISENIMHGDLHLPNALYNKETGDLKIIDFDFARKNKGFKELNYNRDWEQLLGE